ncbi:hypothetical protein GCM10023329_04700 [Streptomyces sanyensis]|uniref:Uncharacterized protein n=1 Tax=Streptomyces sanyensis TaxID=568869 RepID=A0ABP8ZPM4_9ACTN
MVAGTVLMGASHGVADAGGHGGPGPADGWAAAGGDNGMEGVVVTRKGYWYPLGTMAP